MKRVGGVSLSVLLLLGLAGGVSSAAPVEDCAGLTGFGSANQVIVGSHAYCEVKGVLAGSEHFQVRLPISGWQGQYFQLGCDGLCGTPPSLDGGSILGGSACAPVAAGQVVLASDDTGHSGDPGDGKWAKDNVPARVLFGVTSEHLLAEQAKRIIAAYYGKPPTHAYYVGCSTGGRQGLMLAQRFPGDFDGIVAGAPANNMAVLNGMYHAWQVRNDPKLSAGQTASLHQAVIAACGDANGIIEDPRQCGFDPASLQCTAAAVSNCLTAQQVDQVRAEYRGPTDAAGRSLYNGGAPYGSELVWDSGNFINSIGDGRLNLDYLRYMGFLPNPPADLTLGDVPFTDQEFDVLNRLGDPLYNANNPDLSAFRAHGGKIILYHGWADAQISPLSTVDYYAAVERRSGGFAASQSFSRLYMVPGGYHCLALSFDDFMYPDFASAIVNWVEHGSAPAGIDVPEWPSGDQTVRPFDALAPVNSPSGGLNANYHYYGHY
jgi:pimeloyl-ACP methyl ester carboxylesterase